MLHASATGTSFSKFLESLSESQELADLFVDLRDFLARPAQHAPAVSSALLAQVSQVPYFGQRESQILGVPNEAQPANIIGPVFPVASGSSRWRGQQSLAFVKAYGFAIHPGLLRQLTSRERVLIAHTILF